MKKKTKAKIGMSTILVTAGITYLLQYWFKQSGLEDSLLNKLDDAKDIFKGE